MADTCGDPLDCDDVKLGMAAIQAASYVRLADGPNGELRTARRVASCTGGGGGSTVPADLLYTYTNATSGDPTSGNIGFNTTTPASINSVRIHFTDGNGVSQSGLVCQLTTTGGTMLFRWSGGSLVLRIGSSSGSFGSWASYDATYVSGTLPADGTAMSVDVALYPSRAKYYRAEREPGAPDPTVVVGSDTNDLGGTPAWTGDGSGTWLLSLTGAFPDGKRKGWCVNSRNATSAILMAYRDSDDKFRFEFKDLSGQRTV